MKQNLRLSLVLLVMVTGVNAQINLGQKALGALQKGAAGLMFSNDDAAKLSIAAVVKMDSSNTVATAKDPYLLRLNSIFGKHSSEDGLALNYKVYLTKDINAFATADGSVRVFSGLMDIMDNNQLLAVIGHEIGHVAKQHSKQAMKAAYMKAALIEGAASQSASVEAVTNGQLGQIASSLIDSKHSRGQEAEADSYSYDFMKTHGYDVNAVESAFAVLAQMGGGAESSFLDRMMASHPDPKTRAETAKKRAEADGLYKAYVQQAFSNKAPSTTTKAVAKKTVAKKTTKKK